jgi:threonine dehydrogenase-like Zn-dependent dehydrogenase
MEAHGSPAAKLAQTLTGFIPGRAAAAVMTKVGVDRLAALQQSIETVRRGGTISVVGVYSGMTDPLPMLQMFDKGITLRMGQAHVKRWIDDLMPLVTEEADPLGVLDLATHHLPLEQAPHGYEIFQKKQDGAIKVLLNP